MLNCLRYCVVWCIESGYSLCSSIANCGNLNSSSLNCNLSLIEDEKGILVVSWADALFIRSNIVIPGTVTRLFFRINVLCENRIVVVDSCRGEKPYSVFLIDCGGVWWITDVSAIIRSGERQIMQDCHISSLLAFFLVHSLDSCGPVTEFFMIELARFID